MSTLTAADSIIEVAALESRAEDLRSTADELDGPLAVAYRRRAAELELQAAAVAARSGLVTKLDAELAA